MLGDPAEPAAADVQKGSDLFAARSSTRSRRSARSASGDEVAILRVEQLYPFPARELGEMLRRYPANAEVRWVQEEPKNQGAWQFVGPLLRGVLGPERDLQYIGRDEAASPATGSYKIHQAEEASILDEALKRPRLATAEPARIADRAAG